MELTLHIDWNYKGGGELKISKIKMSRIYGQNHVIRKEEDNCSKDLIQRPKYCKGKAPMISLHETISLT